MWEEQKSGTWGDSRVCHWCSYHILTSCVIYYWTDAQQHGIYLFYIIQKQTTTEKAFLFQNLSTGLESQPLPHTLPTLTNTKKAIWCNLLSMQMKQSHCCYALQKNFDRSKKIMPLSKLTRALLLAECKLIAKAKLNCEIYKCVVPENIHPSLPHGWSMEIPRGWGVKR